LTRQGARHVIGVEGLLPRVLYRYELDLHRVLDLTDPDTRPRSASPWTSLLRMTG